MEKKRNKNPKIQKKLETGKLVNVAIHV